MKRWLIRVGLLGVLGSCFGVLLIIFANLFIIHRAKAHIVDYKQPIPTHDVAIVLGARVYPNGKLSNSLTERLVTARWLYKKGKVKRILVSGDNRYDHYNEVKAMYLWLVRHGVPKHDIFLDHAGFRTFDTMVRAAKIFQVKNAIICTQGFHMSRSVFLAQHAGINAMGMNSSGELYYVVRRIWIREFIARAVAVLDVYVLGTQPHHLGDPIPITGDPSITHPKS